MHPQSWREAALAVRGQEGEVVHEYVSVRRNWLMKIMGCAGFLVMLRPVTAANPFALTGLSVLWAFIVGTFGNTPFKYAAYLADLIFNGIVFNQYKHEPNTHGRATVYADRMAEYGIGISIALFATIPHPWYAPPPPPPLLFVPASLCNAHQASIRYSAASKAQKKFSGLCSFKRHSNMSHCFAMPNTLCYGV